MGSSADWAVHRQTEFSRKILCSFPVAFSRLNLVKFGSILADFGRIWSRVVAWGLALSWSDWAVHRQTQFNRKILKIFQSYCLGWIWSNLVGFARVGRVWLSLVEFGRKNKFRGPKFVFSRVSKKSAAGIKRSAEYDARTLFSSNLVGFGRVWSHLVESGPIWFGRV